MQNVMTQGFAAELASGNFSARIFATFATANISVNGPSMIVGTSSGCFDEKAQRTEDGGRTLLMRIAPGSPKFYACINETGGATLMLADEY